MLAIVGLGNPGGRYALTRHNAGFVLADSLRASWQFERFRKIGKADVSAGRLADLDVVLIKPLTYMNLSGQAIKGLLDEPGFDPGRDLLIVVDDVALPIGEFRLRASGSAGGHNGLKSVEGALQTREYARLRVGVGPVPEDGDDLADYVTGEFSRGEWETLMELLPPLTDAVECWIGDGIEVAMNKHNRRKTE